MTWTLNLEATDVPWRANARDGRWGRHRNAKTVRETAFWLATQALKHNPPPDPPVHMTVTFYAPDRRVRDNDGCAVSAKPAVDGLVDAGVLPDDNFKVVEAATYRIVPRPESPGWTIELEPA